MGLTEGRPVGALEPIPEDILFHLVAIVEALRTARSETKSALMANAQLRELLATAREVEREDKVQKKMAKLHAPSLGLRHTRRVPWIVKAIRERGPMSAAQLADIRGCSLNNTASLISYHADLLVSNGKRPALYDVKRE